MIWTLLFLNTAIDPFSQVAKKKAIVSLFISSVIKYPLNGNTIAYLTILLLFDRLFPVEWGVPKIIHIISLIWSI